MNNQIIIESNYNSKINNIKIRSPDSENENIISFAKRISFFLMSGLLLCQIYKLLSNVFDGDRLWLDDVL